MKRSILKGMALFLLLCSGGTLACAQQQKQDTIVVSRDGTGKYRDIQEAVEAVRAFMDYTVTIFIKNGIYKEKLVIPSWVKNVQLVGEDAEKTIITYDDHANINKMGTFRTYTVKVEGSDITFKNLSFGAGSCAPYRRRQADVCRLSFSGKSGYYLYRIGG